MEYAGSPEGFVMALWNLESWALDPVHSKGAVNQGDRGDRQTAKGATRARVGPPNATQG